MNKLISTTFAAACLAATTATVAVAQTTPNAGPPAASGSAHRFAERPFTRPTERVEARLAYLKTALKISDAQQAQWNAFADLVRKNAQEREQRFKSWRAGASQRHEGQRPNAIERMERAQSMHATAVTRLNEMLAVAKPLYAALSPEQQKIADEVLKARPRSAGGQGMHGRGGFERG